MTISSDAGAALGRFGIGGSVDAIRAWLLRARWFGGKERRVRRVELDDLGVIRASAPTILYSLWRVDYEDLGHEVYSVLLGIRPAPHRASDYGPDHLIGIIGQGPETLIVYDALADPEAAAELWRLLAVEGEVETSAGRLVARRQTGIDTKNLDEIHLLDVEQSNSALVRGQRDFFKWSRRIEGGAGIELEMAQTLGEARFPHIPALLGDISYIRNGGATSPQGVLQAYLPNGTEGWKLALTSLRDLYAAAEEAGASSAMERHELVDNQGGSFRAEAARLGEVTADLHLALSAPGLAGDLAPIRVGRIQLTTWADAMTEHLDRLLASANPLAAPLHGKREILVARFDALRQIQDGGLAIRIHGDYHLGQVLRTDAGWKILDFGGEPARDVEERRWRSSPLRDVAGMLRSFDYAADAALAERTSPGDPLWSHLLAAGGTWSHLSREAFWAAYLARLGDTRILPGAGASLAIRRAFELDKAIYEVNYELGHRPDWVDIPLRFLLAAMP
jgi:maltokinase